MIMNRHDPVPEYPPSAQEATTTILPSGIPTPKEIDVLIAMEMNKLTLKEREKALDDVHGIPIDEEEDPMQLLTWLDSMDCHLQTIKQQATAYELAKARSREYVQKMRIMFLRSDRYQPKDAAERMARFFELKKRLFGVESLTKDITLDDFDSDDLDTLNCGCVQVSPLTDMVGRQIYIFVGKLRMYKTPENYVRERDVSLNFNCRSRELNLLFRLLIFCSNEQCFMFLCRYWNQKKSRNEVSWQSCICWMY